ncbi:hypothetical protein CCAX7_22800 [Capsulimonas corticalis]|uniref:Uncharacterized protein n=1 Tax=Capsulimonas corticalis TaxID=2219043 RepID=A0A402CUZ4_9BACT|nr:hypothetical protein [Capsulimonas corticalis]BDI30229.1 hypothetical protein CCAX7_22800 [Capsulimonas corticalis]
MYHVVVRKLAEDDLSVEYAYADSAWKSGEGTFKINKATREIVIAAPPERDLDERFARCGLWAVVKHWKATEQYPETAEYAA